MKKTILALSVLALAACTSVPPFVTQYAMLNSDLKTMGYDTPSSHYYVEKPTSNWAEILSNNDTVLVVQYAQIWLSAFDLDPVRKSELVFSEDAVKQYVAAIDKYLAWAPTAMGQTGSSTTEILTAPSWPHPTADASLKFSLYSESGQAHFLAIAFCVNADGKALSRDPVYFDQKNAAKLRAMLVKFAAGNVPYAAATVGGPNPFQPAPGTPPPSPDD